jgi:epoxyqueuosine reductase
VPDDSLEQQLKAEAARLGFCLAGIAPAVSPEGFSSLTEWLARGMAGEMHYIERRRDAYEHPSGVLESVRSVVMLAMNYHTDDASEPSPATGRVARYAWGTADYHDLLRDRLKQLADFLHQHRPGCRTRGVVDTAPLLERDFARRAGLGWFGKNTVLINRRAGSWLFLAGLLTDVALTPDAPHETAHCGTCTRCLDACPTDAFPEPYVLDARRCISYLTIELRNQPIPIDLRDGMGDWLFGCDICQDVCPWNRKAPRTSESAFQPQPDLRPADAIGLLQLDAAAFKARFRHTPLERPGRAGLLRNAAIVLGNTVRSDSPPSIRDAATAVLISALNDPEPLIRGAAAWALGKIGEGRGIETLRQRALTEEDEGVRDEMKVAIQRGGTLISESPTGLVPVVK